MAILKKYLLVVFLLSSSFSFSQNPDIKRTMHWYFGDKAGLDFSSGVPMAVTNSQMVTLGNPVSMSDTAGNLLFYSNHFNVWNKNHQLMPNGTGLVGGGGSDQFRPALCIPQPESNNIYYIFYWQYDSINPFDWNMVYAIVDMNLDGGLGDVVSKQNFLMNKPTDGIAATKHSNNNDIWITNLKMNTDTFYSFLLDNTGLSLPIKSNGGISNWTNNLKFSPDGTKLAATLQRNGPEIFDFDKITGMVSNPVVFPSICINCESFGLEFSPDNKKLYASYRFEVSPAVTWTNSVYQIDLSGTSSQILNSKILLDTTVISDSAAASFVDDMTFAIQLGADGKIYTTNVTRPKLGSINFPNVLGIGCNYIDSSIYLLGRNCWYGLPLFSSDYFFDSSLVTVTNILDMDENIICYPNPFIYSTNIIIPSSLTILDVELLDLLGRKTEVKKKITKENDKTVVTLERNNLSAGIYFLNIKTNNHIYSQKLVITN